MNDNCNKYQNKTNIENMNIKTKIIQLKNKLQQLKKKKQETKLRTQANIENIKKNAEDRIIQLKIENLDFFLKNMSNIINQFDQVFEIAKQKNIANHSIIEGIKLTKKSLSNNIKKFKIQKPNTI